MKRLVCLNLRAGGGRRAGALCEYLASLAPDLAVLTEWRQGPAGAQFQAWAGALGLHHATLNDGGTANGVMIVARAPFKVTSVTPRTGATGAVALARFAELSVLACYFPSMKEKAPFFDTATAAALRHQRRKFILLGDLNTGNQLADREPAGVRYHCADQFDAFSRDHRLIDLWRHSQGEAREWSWHSHRQNGFRLDHAFANRAFVKAHRPHCAYDHTPRMTGLSDHSAVVIDLNAPKPRHPPAAPRRL
jgi:exodeoxyribonuclease-3